MKSSTLISVLNAMYSQIVSPNHILEQISVKRMMKGNASRTCMYNYAWAGKATKFSDLITVDTNFPLT